MFLPTLALHHNNSDATALLLNLEIAEVQINIKQIILKLLPKNYTSISSAPPD